MCIRFIKYTHSFHHTRIFFPHFVGVYVYAGTINRPLRLRTDCQNVANGLPITLRTFYKMPNQRSVKCPHSPTKCPRNTPPGVGDRFIAPVSLHNQMHTSISPNTCFHIIKYAFPFPISWVFPYTRAR